MGPFRVVRSEAELQEAVAALGGRVFLKIGAAAATTGAARRGLDSTVYPRKRSCAGWQSIGARPAVAEQALDLECEISVMAARNPSGEVRQLSRGAQSP